MKKIILLLATCFTLSAISQTSINKKELPSQTGHAGQYLKTNGTVPTWTTVSAGLSGSLTAGYIPYAVNSSSLFDSPFYINSGNAVYTSTDFNASNIRTGTFGSANGYYFSLFGNIEFYQNYTTIKNILRLGGGYVIVDCSDQYQFKMKSINYTFSNQTTEVFKYIENENRFYHNSKLNIQSIPTSPAGLISGDIYSNLGVLMIVP